MADWRPFPFVCAFLFLSGGCGYHAYHDERKHSGNLITSSRENIDVQLGEPLVASSDLGLRSSNVPLLNILYPTFGAPYGYLVIDTISGMPDTPKYDVQIPRGSTVVVEHVGVLSDHIWAAPCYGGVGDRSVAFCRVTSSDHRGKRIMLTSYDLHRFSPAAGN